MGDGNLFRGTNIDQDSRFSDKQKKLLRAMRFDPSLSAKVNMENVNLDVVKPWIHKRITELLGGIEDEVLIAYIFELLEASKHPDPKELQIAVTGFLNGKNARVFMGELWSHLVSAQESVGGVPAAFLEKKKEEIRKRKQEQERIQERLGKTQSVEADSTAPDPDERETRNSVLLAARKAEIVVRSIKAEEASSRYIMPIPTTIEMEIATPNQQMTEQKQIRKSLTGYLNSPAATPAGRDNKAGWYAEHEKYLEISRTSSAGVLLIGDSLISGLARYPRIWNKYFQPLKALNFGIGGDRTQHVLWRVENGEIPQNTQMVVIHVGTNNTDRDEPKDIANGISSIAMIFQEAKPNCKVIITGLLPRDLEPSFRREKITKVNKYLKHFCASGHIRNFFYLKPDDDWVKADGTLDTRFYFQDFLHLVEEGDEKFASSIYKMITKVFGGQPVECEDTDVSDDDLAVTTTKTPAIPIPRSRSRSRSGSHPKLVGRSRHSPSNSPRLSLSPRRRRRRRSSRSPPRRRSRSPRRRRSFTRSRSRSRSRTPRRRIRSQSGSPSRSPAPAAVVLHDHRKDSSPRRRRVFKEDGANKVVEIKPADEGLLKGDTSDEVEAAKPALSPTQYSKSDKTQTRTYRRQHSESEGSPEPEGPVLAPGFKSGEQSDHRRSRDAKKETVRPRDRDAERRRDSRDSIRAKERDAGQRKTSRSGDRKDSPRRKSPPRRRESPKRDMSPRRKRSPHREEGVRSSNDYQPNPRDSRPPGALKRRAPTFSPSPERKARRSPVPPARRESPIRKRARRGSSDEEAASAKRPRPQESGSEVDTPPDVARRREDKKKRDGDRKPDKQPTDESGGKRRPRNASQSFSSSEGEAETREQMVEAARRRVARKSSESAESSAEEEPRRKVIIRKQESEESAEDRPRKQQSASKRRDAKPNTESESSDKEPERNARPTRDRIEVSVKGKPARVAAKSESSSGDDDDESDHASRRRVVVTKSSKEAVPSESEDDASDEEVRQEKITPKNPKTDREVRRRREESESVERAVQRKQSSRDKDKQQQQQVRRKERAPARQEDASSEEERESERTAKRSPRKKVAQARQRSASRDESPEQLPEDAPPSDDDNEGEGDSCGRDEVDDRKKGKAEREEAADEGEEVEDSVEESPDLSQKTKKRKRSDREKSARGDRARPRPRESTKSNRKSKKRRRHTDGSDEDSEESDMEVKLREQALKSMKAKRGSSGESSD